MRSLSPESLLEQAEDRAAEERGAINKYLGKTNATLSSIREIAMKFPDKDQYAEPSAEANFRVKILNLLDNVIPISRPETPLIEKYIVQLNDLQLEVARAAARLIPRFDRSRRVEVAELELYMRELAKMTGQLQGLPMGAIRRAEEASQIVRRIKAQSLELKQLQSTRDSTTLESEKLRHEVDGLRERAKNISQSALACKLDGLDAEIAGLRQRVSELFAPIAKPMEKLKKLLEDRRSPTLEIMPLLDCVEDPSHIVELEGAELAKAGQILRGYIERGELSIKQSRAKRALEAISELNSRAPDLKEGLGTLLKGRTEVLSSREAIELNAERREVDDKMKMIENKLSGLASSQANFNAQIDRCSLRIQNLKKEAEMLAESILSEPVTLTIS